jgi:hypothetical protein
VATWVELRGLEPLTPSLRTRGNAEGQACLSTDLCARRHERYGSRWGLLYLAAVLLGVRGHARGRSRISAHYHRFSAGASGFSQAVIAFLLPFGVRRLTDGFLTLSASLFVASGSHDD